MANTVKATLENYIIVRNRDDRLWITPDERASLDCTQVLGMVVDKEANYCGPVMTSNIQDLHDGLLYTKSGSIYKLGSPHKDYVAFVEARKKGVKILKWCHPTWTDDGVILVGHNFDNDSDVVSGRIIKQNNSNNTVTLENNEMYYCHWLDMDLGIRLFLMEGLNGSIFEEVNELLNHLSPEDLEFYGFTKCKLPILV